MYGEYTNFPIIMLPDKLLNNYNDYFNYRAILKMWPNHHLFNLMENYKLKIGPLIMSYMLVRLKKEEQIILFEKNIRINFSLIDFKNEIPYGKNLFRKLNALYKYH